MVFDPSARPLSFHAAARQEWRRVRDRPAFRRALIAWAVVMPVGFGFSAPLFGGPHSNTDAAVLVLERLGLPFMIVTVTLLAAAPVTLRHGILFRGDDTSRETPSFAALLALIGGLGVLLWTSTAAVALVFALAARATSADATALLRILAMLPFLLLVGAIALLFATLSREVSIAIAAAYMFILFQGPLLTIVAAYRGIWQELTAYTPWSALESLSSRNSFDAGALAALQQRARAGGRPLLLAAAPATALALAWTAAACALARMRSAHRDPL